MKRALLITCAIALIYPAVAIAQTTPKTDWLSPGSYTDTSLSSKYGKAESNARVQNFTGALVERKLNSRVAAGASIVGLASGVAVSITQLWPSTWPYWARAAGNVAAGAAAGFAAGCATGAAVGLLPAAVSGGLTVPAGCIAFGVQAAIAGGFTGGVGTDVCIDEGCTIKTTVGKDEGVFGEGVKGSEKTVDPNRIGYVYQDSCNMNSNNTAISCSTSANLATAYVTIGTNRTFPCKISDKFRACVFVPALQSGERDIGTNTITNAYLGGGGGINMFGRVLIPGGYGLKQSDPRCAGPSCWFQANVVPYVSSPTYPRSVVTMLASPTVYNFATEVPEEKVVTAPARPLWADLLSSKLDEQAAQLKVSNKLLAAMANQAMKDSGDANWNPADPVTEADVQALKIARPDIVPRVSDLVRPYDFTDREPQGASETKPAQVATPVTVTNGGASNGNGSSGFAGLEMKVQGEEPTIPLPTVNVGSFTYDPGTCPGWNVGYSSSDAQVQSVLDMMGVPKSKPFDAYCEPLLEAAPWLRPMILIFIGISCFGIFRR